MALNSASSQALVIDNSISFTLLTMAAQRSVLAIPIAMETSQKALKLEFDLSKSFLTIFDELTSNKNWLQNEN
jgi:hypothetical protein